MSQSAAVAIRKGIIWQQYFLPIRIAMLLLEHAVDVDVISFNSVSHVIMLGKTHGRVLVGETKVSNNKQIAQHVVWMFCLFESLCCWIPKS